MYFATRLKRLGSVPWVVLLIYVYIRLRDAPFYHFILKVIKKQIVIFSLFLTAAVTHILDIHVTLL